MKTGHKEKIEELSEKIRQAVRMEATRLYHSGGIDREEYNEHEYSLAKVLITAAMVNVKDSFYPVHSKKLQDDIKNLKHF